MVKIMKAIKFDTTPTKVFFGVKSIKTVPNLIRLYNPKNILVISGEKTVERCNFEKYLEGYALINYKIGSNPTVNDIENCLGYVNNSYSADLIVGLGGGSAIDTGKTVALLLNNLGSVKGYLHKKEKIEKKGKIFVAIPTTAGTGSEVTPYASIIDEKEKLSLSHEYLCPHVAIVDPSLTLTLPPRLTAITGMDALIQGIEAYWSINSTPQTDKYALEAIKLSFENLKKACENPQDIKYRINMSRASLLSGAAISHTKTTIVHSVSYPLTTYFNIPHGLACSLTIPYFMKFNAKAVPEKIIKISKTIGAKSIQDGVKRIEDIITDIGLETKLSDFGIKKRDIKLIVENGFRSDRANNNPRSVTKNDLRKILMKIL
jgi:alcohol dehydrogenase